jgi:hypothetical protein
LLPLAGVTASHKVANQEDATVDTSIATAILPTIVQPMPPAPTDAAIAATVVAPVAAPVAAPPPPPEDQTAIAPTIMLPPPPTAARPVSSFTLSPALVALVVISAIAGAGSSWWHSRSAAPAITAAPAAAPAAPPSATPTPEAPQTPTVAAPAPATPESTAAAAETAAASPAAAETPEPSTSKPTRLPNPAATPARTARGASESKLPEPAPEPPESPAPAAPPVKEVAAPVAFAAKMLMREGDKARERDATVRLADGQVTVTASDRSVLSTVPYDALLSVIYSKSKQPLWNAPGGAIPIQKVEGGAFGFLKGGRHWVSLRTKERFVILRLDENQVAAALAAIEERTGKPAVRVAEPKESQ